MDRQDFDYERATRQRYQDADRARVYHSKFTGGDWRKFRSLYVTRQERRMLHAMLAPHMPGVVLDLPCGTGKMAPVLADLGAVVVAADISQQMIQVARAEYAVLDYPHVEFIHCDAESVTSALGDRHVDVACCVRLLHRVPHAARRRILSEFAKAAPVSVLSYAVTSPAARLRGMALRKKGALAERVTCRDIQAELGEFFTVLAAQPISRSLCSEWFFLVRSAAKASPAA